MINVIKRDGRTKNFDKHLIEKAVCCARKDIGCDDENLDLLIADEVVNELQNNNVEKVTVEEIQDLVVKWLKIYNSKVEKVYSEYREKRSLEREHPVDRIINKLIAGTNLFLSKENANKNSTLISTQRDLMAGSISRHLAFKKLPKKIQKAINDGIIKLHDMDYAINPMTNCCLIPLDDLFKNGTVINDTKIETPKSLTTAMTLATQIITQVTSFQYGGCTISLSHIAPYVRVSKEKFKKIVKNELDNSNISYTEEQVKNIVDIRIRKEIKDSIQTFNYQTLTMSSTNGQSPFVTIFAYLNENPEYKEEIAMLLEEFLKQRIQGMPDENGNMVTQVFPKIIFALDEDNIHKDSEYYWLLELALKSTAKRMSPDYISAKVMKELYGEVFPCINKICA